MSLMGWGAGEEASAGVINFARGGHVFHDAFCDSVGGNERMTFMRSALWLIVPALLGGCLGRSGDSKDGSEVVDDGGGGAKPSSGGQDSGGGSSSGGLPGSGGDGSGGAGGSKDDCPPLTKTVSVFNLGKAEELLELEGVTVLEGSLHVGWVLEDFSGLSCLTEITGNLTIKGATDLSSLAGLENLRSIGGTLRIGDSCPGEGSGYDCAAINAVEEVSLPGLKTAGKIFMHYNPELVLVSFPSLESVESIYFGPSPKLAEVHFGALTETEELTMLALPALTEVTAPALSRLDSVHVEDTGISRIDFLSGAELKDVILVGNPGLVSVAPLAGTTQLNSLAIRGSEVMTDLDGLQDLEVATEGIGMSWNTALTSIEALGSLRHVGGLSLSTLPLLESLSGLQNLETIDGRLGISNIDNLSSLEGLHPDIQVGELSIRDNPLLTSLEGFEHLDVLGLLAISGNHALVDLTGLNNVTSVDQLHISSNAGLSSLTGLESLQEVTSVFQVESCPLLPTCQVHRLLDELDPQPETIWLGPTDDEATCDEP